MGILGKVEAGAGIGVAVVAVGGAYYVYKKAPEWFPNGIGSALGDWFAKLWGGFGGGGPVPHIMLSKTSAKQGETIGIAVDALLPSTNLVYGWRELGYSEVFQSLADGTWYGGGNGVIEIAFTTPPGQYTIYVDQRPYGGPYYETKFTVLAGDEPDPEPQEANGLRIIMADSSLSLGEPADITVQLYHFSTPIAQAGVEVAITYQGDVIDTGVTNSSGRYRTMLGTSVYFGGNRGTKLIYAAPIPFNGDPAWEDSHSFTVN